MKWSRGSDSCCCCWHYLKKFLSVCLFCLVDGTSPRVSVSSFTTSTTIAPATSKESVERGRRARKKWFKEESIKTCCTTYHVESNWPYARRRKPVPSVAIGTAVDGWKMVRARGRADWRSQSWSGRAAVWRLPWSTWWRQSCWGEKEGEFLVKILSK